MMGFLGGLFVIICIVTVIVAIVEVSQWSTDGKILSTKEMTKILFILKYEVKDDEIKLDGLWSEEITFGGKLPNLVNCDMPILTKYWFKGHGRVLRFTTLHKVLTQIHKTFEVKNKKPWDV